MNKFKKISSSVIQRLPRYYRFLTSLQASGVEKISSNTLAKKMHLTASQIRQDLNYFGGFGQQGYGYNLENLISEISKILSLNELENIILIGAGSLGYTIASRIDFEQYGFKLIDIFDSNVDLLDTCIHGVTIHHIDNIGFAHSIKQCDTAILCLPKGDAEKVCPKLIALGIQHFWNFSHYDLQLDYENIIVENVHLADSLMRLSYRIKENRERED